MVDNREDFLIQLTEKNFQHTQACRHQVVHCHSMSQILSAAVLLWQCDKLSSSFYASVALVFGTGNGMP